MDCQRADGVGRGVLLCLPANAYSADSLCAFEAFATYQTRQNPARSRLSSTTSTCPLPRDVAARAKFIGARVRTGCRYFVSVTT